VYLRFQIFQFGKSMFSGGIEWEGVVE